jgi:hypothetical protein
MGDRALLDLLVEDLGILKRAAIGKDGIGVLAGKLDAGIGRTGLEDHGLSLPGSADIQRSFDTEEAPLVIQAMQLGLVGVNARFAVAREGIVIPGVPQALGGIEIFVCDLIAQLVFGVLSAVVAAGAFERRGYGIPAGAAAADEVERGELTGNGEGVAVGRRNRADQAELRRKGRKRRQDGQRLEPVEEMRDRLLVDVKAVGDEGEGDAGLFRLTGRLDEKVEIGAGISFQAFMWPPGPCSMIPKVTCF